MWKLVETEEFTRRCKWFAKKRRRELLAALDNLDTLKQALNEGLTIEQVPGFGFIHVVPAGAFAIDQKGAGARLRQTRLYDYLEKGVETMHLITLGEKDTQAEDIRTSKEFVDELLQRKEADDASDETL